jgi:endonuclease YncB( thermonuclease family)
MTASVQDGWPLFRERQRPGLRAWLVLLPLLAGLFLGSAAGADERVQVKRVYDGDTVLLQDGRKVRYLGINAPEFQEPYYLKAKRFNESLVLQRQIRLEYDREPVDAYDRLLAYVYADDRMVNAALLERAGDTTGSSSSSRPRPGGAASACGRFGAGPRT